MLPRLLHVQLVPIFPKGSNVVPATYMMRMMKTRCLPPDSLIKVGACLSHKNQGHKAQVT